jgi:hypothetical protein
MKKGKLLLGVLLTVSLLLAVFVEIGLARPEVKSSGGPGGNALTISAADCYPYTEDVQYVNWGYFIRGNSGTGQAIFICPIRFPEYGTHRVRSVTIYVQDRLSGVDKDVFVKLYRTSPGSGNQALMGQVRSTGSSTTMPRAFTIGGSGLANRNVSQTQGMHLRVSMSGSNYLAFFGARVRYIAP